MRLFRFFLLFGLAVIFSNCAAKKFKDISYIPQTKAQVNQPPKLNVFIPRKLPAHSMPVLIFVHGGNWNSGSKDTYGFFGRNFAKKNVVTVIPDYTLSPQVDYKVMTQQIAQAIRWAKSHIAQYHGDPGRIFLTGHSAGGHLVALAVMNPEYGIDPNDISGIILNDAGGLDMAEFLQKKPPKADNNYKTTWTTNPEIWEKASPINFIDQNTPPIMMYMGSKSYAFIKSGSRKFLNALEPYQPDVAPIVLPKKHVSMIIQFFWPWSPRFAEIKSFIQAHSAD